MRTTLDLKLRADAAFTILANGYLVDMMMDERARLLGVIADLTPSHCEEALATRAAPLARIGAAAEQTLSSVLQLAEACAPRPSPSPRLARLTKREREVATLLAEGHATLNVAATLSISEHTVRVHVRNIYRKLGVCSRVELARAFDG